MEYKKIEGIAYNLHLIKTDRFKKNMIKINFKNKLVKEEIVKRRLIPNILVESNSIYDTKRLMDIKTEDLYNMDVYGNITVSGNSIITSFIGSFLNDKYTEDGLLEQALTFMFDLIFKPKVVNDAFDTKAFNLSKESLREEIESIKEDPAEYSMERTLEELGPNTSLALHTYGYVEDLDNLTEEELYQYYLYMLKSDVVDIFVIGNIDFDNVEKLLKDIPIVTKKKHDYEHYINHTKFKNKYRKVDEQIDNNQSILTLGYKLENMTDFEKQYVLPIYSYILGGGPDSRLFLNVREKNSLCYTISSQVRIVSNIMLISAGINADNYKKCFELIKEQVSLMGHGKFDDEDIEKAKLTYISAYKETNDSLPAIINTYVSHEYLNMDLLDDKEKNIKKVTKEDIMKIIPKIHPEVVYFLEGTKKDEENTTK